MADANQKEPAYNILGSEKLNTPGGANPAPKPHTESSNKGIAAGQAQSEEYKKSCIAAHNALEDKLREKERLARWRRE